MSARNTQRLGASGDDIHRAAELLQAGGLVAIPTETVYGLAANAFDPVAVAGIFAAKQRPSWDPLIVHVSSRDLLERVIAEFSVTAQALAAAFWPGPLTLLLPRGRAIGDAVTAGRSLVGVRWPNHPVAQAVLAAANLPLAAPSANRFGHVSPSTAAHVLADLNGRIDAVLDGGPTEIGLESTVLDPNTTPITIYRQGAVSAAEVKRVTGIATTVFQPKQDAEPQSLPSPGVGIRHYAPHTPLRIVFSEAALHEASADSSLRTAVLRPREWLRSAAAAEVVWGSWENTAELAHNLYAALRDLDRSGCDRIVAPLPDLRPGDDLRAALRDRLLKAAMPPGR